MMASANGPPNEPASFRKYPLDGVENAAVAACTKTWSFISALEVPSINALNVVRAIALC